MTSLTALQDWLQLFAGQLRQTDFIQWLALFLGVTEVFLARANKIALYPAGIAASGISIYLLWEAGLYAECLLNFYYVVMSIYGWWHWVRKKNVPPVRISHAGKKEWSTVLAIVLFGYLTLYLVLKHFTPSTVPHWDAWVTATAWAGMWLLAKRKIENWILLNISNAFAIPLLIHKELPLYALLTLILFAVAVEGYFNWRRKYKEENGTSIGTPE